MCFFNSPEAPPPPPPPPQAPPVLEQDTPKLSETGDNSYLDTRRNGMKNYKIQKRNAYMSDKNKLGGTVQTSKSNV